MNGAELLARELRRRGVRHVATLCGHGLDPLDEALDRTGIRLVDVRNEQSAGYIAEATGRLSRKVGVCAVSSGVAHANAMTGVVNAYFDGAPMMLITGSGPRETIGLGHFQDLDQVALADPVCKYSCLIDRPERIGQYLHEAFSAAISGRPGPVHLTFPLDVQQREVPLGGIHVHRPMSVPESQPGPSELSRVASMMADAERPVIVAGSGVYYAKGERALASFCDRFAIPAMVPVWDRGSFPVAHSAYMGVIGAATGGAEILADADLVIVLGARSDYRLGYLQPPTVDENAAIVRVDADPAELDQGTGAHVTVTASPAAFLRDLEITCELVIPKTDWLIEAQGRKQTYRHQVVAAQRPDEGCHALDVVEAIGEALTPDTTLVIDGGNIGQWAHQVLNDSYPGHWLTCGISGVVGYGIAGAMAARLNDPDHPVILLSGDGALTFTIAELEAATRQGLPFVVVLADDQAWGITLTGHEGNFGRGITSELGPIDYVAMARSFGAEAMRIEEPEAILPAILTAVGADVPTLIHVPVVRSNPLKDRAHNGAQTRAAVSDRVR